MCVVCKEQMKNIIPVMYEPVHAPVANSLAQLDLVDLPVHCIKILPMYLTRFFPLLVQFTDLYKYSDNKN